MGYTIIRGGLVLDIRAGTAEAADILIEDDTIRELGPAGVPAPEGAREIAAARRLIHPGLVNAHTHSHGNLGKGMGDRWTLELLLAAAPWIGGNRTRPWKNAPQEVSGALCFSAISSRRCKSAGACGSSEAIRL
jgi:5-methylthioadenosine/S-adenosylhomocysteine deaminase